MFIRSKKLEITNIGYNQYVVKLEPLEYGFGHTLGIMFRRIFLSLLSGYAITHVRISRVVNEFSGFTGLKEDIVDILSNLKKIRFTLVGCTDLNLTIKKEGVTRIVAGDFVSSNITVFNPEQLILTITDAITVILDVKISKGYGHCFKGFNKLDFSNINDNNWISLNATYSPILSSFFKVESFFLKNSLFDSLVMNITTNGTVDPKKCMYEASYILLKQLPFFFSLFNNKDDLVEMYPATHNADVKEINEIPISLKRIDELNLASRSLNCLKVLKIFYVSDLLKKSETDLLKIANFGKKSLLEIKVALNELGLSLNVDSSFDKSEGVSHET